METRTYLINTAWDYFKKELKQVDGNEVTIQFKVMDKYTMIEIIGIKKSIGKQFTHQIICHKDQNITILENKNDQVEFEKQPINSNVDRVHFNQSFENKNDGFKIYNEEKVLVANDIQSALEILENNGYIIEPNYNPTSTFGLHGQLELFDGVN